MYVVNTSTNWIIQHAFTACCKKKKKKDFYCVP